MGAYMKSIECYEECLDIEERLCGETHTDVAITLADLGNVHSLLGEHAKSIGYYEEALQIRRQVHDGLHPYVAQILYSLGNVHKNSGDLTRALAHYGEAFRMYQLLGATFQHCSKHTQAVEYFEKALGVGKKIHGDIHPDVAVMLYRLASRPLKIPSIS
ncbi:MAG: tetratricopeptide repeat protein [Bacteroidota bacterium]